MKPAERRQRLDGLLPMFHDLWHAQPFRTPRPEWSMRFPALTRELLALDDVETSYLSDDSAAALRLLSRHFPDVAELVGLGELPAHSATPLPISGERWAWEIPGRKRSQIEAFAAATQGGQAPIVDWCGGKGHLGRLLGLGWGVSVRTVEIDPVLCGAGRVLAGRLPLKQDFWTTDALLTDVPADCHAVALHACGELHRHLIERGAKAGVVRFDVAPCCYHRGVTEAYQPLSSGSLTRLTRDDTRLAVTETVTASPRLRRKRDQEMAWKLGFDAYRRACGVEDYKSFKSIPSPWFGTDFSAFLLRMAGREGLPLPSRSFDHWESEGWKRQREVLRLSIVRQAFRRLLEQWLALDLVVYLESHGYVARLGTFCERRLTPRNLLISAWRS